MRARGTLQSPRWLASRQRDATSPCRRPGPGRRAPPSASCTPAPTARRSDLPPSALDCLNGVGLTHIHPSWRDFAAISLRPLPPDRYDILLDDVPVAARVSFRINDQNSCDQNPTGAVTRNVFANDVRLMQNATTPGDEPGYAFMVARDGTVTQ